LPQGRPGSLALGSRWYLCLELLTPQVSNQPGDLTGDDPGKAVGEIIDKLNEALDKLDESEN